MQDLTTDQVPSLIAPDAGPGVMDGIPTQSAWIEQLRRPRVHLLLLCLLVIAVFGNSLAGGFVYDDHRMVMGNPLLGHWELSTFRTILTRDYWAALSPELPAGELDSLYYRPFYHVFEMFAYAVAGRSPALWHLISVLLHAVGVILAYLMLDRSMEPVATMQSTDRRMISLFAAAIFAVHPVQGESVAWIAASANSIIAIFLFGSFLCYLKYSLNRRWYWIAAAAILFLMGALTKENALCLPAVVGTYELFVLRRSERWAARLRPVVWTLVPFALATALYFCLRFGALHFILGQFGNENFRDDATLTMIDRLRTLPLVLWEYTKLAVAPVDLALMYDVGMVRAATLTSFWFPLLFVLAFVGVAIYTCRRIPEAWLAVAWIAMPLLPHLTMRSFVSEEVVHDRYLYLSMIGVGLYIALLTRRISLVPRWRLSRPLVTGLAVLAVAACCVMSFRQNRVWVNDETIWRRAAEEAPASRIVHLALGQLAEEQGDLELALSEYDAVLRVNPDVVDGLNNSAFVLAKLGNWNESVVRFEHIARLTPRKATAHANLAVAYSMLQRYPEALIELEHAIELAPQDQRVRMWRAQAERLKRTASAAMRKAE